MPKSSDITDLYAKHAGELLAYFARRSPAGEADDLLHETFLQVVRSAHLASVTQPRAWLFGIARNILSRHYREESDRVLSAAAAIQQEAAHAGGELAADPRLALMREAIDQLSPELRETLQLRLEHELSYEEIATVLEIPVGTVRSRLHNAVQRLQQALRPGSCHPSSS